MHGAAGRSYRPVEIAADRGVHFFGLLAGGFGSAVLIGLACRRLNPGQCWPILVYAAGLLAMLGCSAAYNLNPGSSRRETLRRLDHAAIFLMIAGTYTPFTTRMLSQTWAMSMTGSVWVLAVLGVITKLRYPHRIERIGLALYLAFGWIIAVAWQPFLSSIDSKTAALIVSGGIVYTIGAGVHAWRGLQFQNAIWHGLVLIAAGCHYIAVMHGVLSAANAM